MTSLKTSFPGNALVFLLALFISLSPLRCSKICIHDHAYSVMQNKEEVPPSINAGVTKASAYLSRYTNVVLPAITRIECVRGYYMKRE